MGHTTQEGMRKTIGGRNNYNQNPNLIPIANNRNFNQGNGGNANNENRQNPPCPPQAQGNQRPNANVNPKNDQRAHVHHMQAMDETNEEVAHLHAAIEHQDPNRQYAVLRTPVEYKGITFNLLIDSGETRSFLSPASVRKMRLNPQNDTKLKVELATGKQTQSSTSVKNL